MIRIQPLELEIPNDKPFEYDLLNREESATILTDLLRSIEGPCVIGIDAPWGAGKTTFLKMWAQHMRNEGFPVVEFNAWNTDFSQDPFIALSTQLEQSLKDFSEDGTPTGYNNRLKDRFRSFDKDKVGEFSKCMSKAMNKMSTTVINQLFQSLVSQLTMGTLDLSKLVEASQGQDNGQEIEKYAETRRSAYREAVNSLTELRASLEAVVAQPGEYNSKLEESLAPQPQKADSQSVRIEEAVEERRPLVVFIDELDRCRPTYAIELLEVAKHLFAVDGVVFVLGVNRSELAHSVKAVYGASFEAEGYLHRFFDVDIRLPSPDRTAFVQSQIKAIRLNTFFTTQYIYSHWNDPNLAYDLLLNFFSRSALSLRDIAQAIHRLGIMLTSIKSSDSNYATFSTSLLITRTIDRSVYEDLINSEASDKQIIDRIFKAPGMNDLRYGDQHNYGTIFEALIIYGCWLLKHPHGYHDRQMSSLDSIKAESEMIEHCKKIMDSKADTETSDKADTETSDKADAYTPDKADAYTPEEITHAERLMQKVNAIPGDIDSYGVAFKRSINHLELIWKRSSG